MGPATEGEILAKTRWLAEQLGRKERPTGLMTFSGHGDVISGAGDVLCPSDAVWEAREGGAGLAHAVSFRALNEIFARHGVGDELTVVLDTCHAAGAGDAAPGAQPLTLTGQAALEPATTGGPLLGRVLRASRRGQPAYQTKLDGRYRGLFSWALTTAMDQWRATQDGGAVRLDLRYGKLVETADRLMAALWFDQTPELTGPPGVADLAVFQHGLAPRPGATTDKPNGAFLTAQIDGGNDVWRSIQMVCADTGAAIAQVHIYNEIIGSFQTGIEYWYVCRSNLSRLGSAGVNITVTDSNSRTGPSDPGYSPEQKFSQAQNPSGGWGTGWTTDPVSGGHLYTGPNGSYFRIKLSTDSPPIITYVAWYQVLSSGSPANLDPTGSWTVNSSGSVSVPSGSTGYDINQSNGT